MIMIRSCPDRLEFKNECYSTVNKSISKSNDICINIMVRTKTKPFLKRKKVPKFYFHFGQQKKFLPSLLTYTWRCENITASPCGYNGMSLHVMEQPPRFFALTYRVSDACIYQ